MKTQAAHLFTSLLSVGASLSAFIRSIAAVFTLLALAAPARAQVVTSDPSLPVLYPNGVYRTTGQVFATYHVDILLTIVSTNVELRARDLVSRTTNEPNELEVFDMRLVGFANAFQSGAYIGSFPSDANGPSVTETFGKTGNTTGTFNTEMSSLNLSGNSLLGPFMIRESLALPSLGQTSVTDLGGGLYRIESHFALFTELSTDGGVTWVPDADGPVDVILMEVPGPLNIRTQPQSRTNDAGTTATFTVTASGSPPLSYQWWKNSAPLADSSNISGATTATLTLAHVSQSYAGGYTVVVSNAGGSVTSSVTTLTVMDLPFSTNLAINWFTLDGGGGASTNSTLSVSGAIGQPDAGKLSGSTLAIKGGFWGIITAVQTPGAPILTVAPAVPGQATISWTPDRPGFVLQETAVLSPANWSNSPSGATNPIVVPATLPTKFYRLFEP